MVFGLKICPDPVMTSGLQALGREGQLQPDTFTVDVFDGDLTGVSGRAEVLTGEDRETGDLAGVTGGDSTEEKGEALWLAAVGKVATF